jgi:hypothetical protein
VILNVKAKKTNVTMMKPRIKEVQTYAKFPKIAEVQEYAKDQVPIILDSVMVMLNAKTSRKIAPLTN